MSTSTSDNYMIDHYGTPWCNQCGHKLLVEDDCIQPHEHATTQAEAELPYATPLTLEYLELDGKQGLFEGSLLVATIVNLQSKQARQLGRTIEMRVNTYTTNQQRIAELEAALCAVREIIVACDSGWQAIRLRQLQPMIDSVLNRKEGE